MLDLARPVHALVAGIATLLVLWPISALLEGGGYVESAFLVVLAVAVTGMLTRALRVPPLIIVLGQSVVAVLVVAALFARDTLWAFLPTPTSFARLGDLLAEGGEVLRTYTVPAPATEGVQLLIVVLVVLVAVSVDAIAVTLLAPVYAGIPLTAGFLASVSNSGEALEPWYFLAIGAAWLALVSLETTSLLGAWSTMRRTPGGDRQDVASGAGRTSRSARLLALVAVVVAVIAPLALPHLPPTYFGQGLARSPGGEGAATGEVSFAETLDLSEDLASQSDDIVISYDTDEVGSVLRITASDVYDAEQGRWLPATTEPEATASAQVSGNPEGLDPRVAEDATEVDVEVLDSTLQAPQVALPYPLVEAQFDGDVARVDPEGQRVVVDETVTEYTSIGLDLPSVMPDGVGDREEVALHEGGRWLEVPEAARQDLEELNAEVLGDTDNDLQRAILLQRHFRSAQYTYDLQLVPNTDGTDPLLHFLQTRQGYCVQFATGMIMAARAEGIPARLGVGFIPGVVEEDGSRAVRASDAHAWPELWITGLGWTRFEPTPGVRTGTPPAYSSTPIEPIEEEEVGDPEVEEVPPPEINDPPAAEVEDEPAEAQDDGLIGTVLDAIRSALPVVVLVLAILVPIALIVLGLMAAGRAHREAGLRRAEGPTAVVEGSWTYLVRSLRDLGVPQVPERSPEQMAAAYVEAARLDETAAAAMVRVGRTLQEARYAPPGRVHLQDTRRLDRDVTTVIDAVRADLPWNLRFTSRYFPISGLLHVRDLLSGPRRRRPRRDDHESSEPLDDPRSRSEDSRRDREPTDAGRTRR